MLEIRLEEPRDAAGVRVVNERAFSGPTEAALVDALRGRPGALSLVADDDGVVGHILFTPIAVDGTPALLGRGLAPVAVLPERQRQGIGSLLVERGLELLRGQGCELVIVLGHPEFYPRFGFVPASRFGLLSQWEGVPDEAFMALVMDESALVGVSGVARYLPEFDAAV